MSTVKPVIRNVRLSPELDALLVAQAEDECEGNVSQMLRRLITYGLTGRSSPAEQPPEPVPDAVQMSSARVTRRKVPQVNNAEAEALYQAVREVEPVFQQPSGRVRSEKTTVEILAERAKARLRR